MHHAQEEKYKIVDDATTLLAGIKALFRFPFYTGGQWYISNYEASAFKRVLNDGDVAIDLTVELKATAQVPVSYTHLDVYKRQTMYSPSVLRARRPARTTIWSFRKALQSIPAR